MRRTGADSSSGRPEADLELSRRMRLVDFCVAAALLDPARLAELLAGAPPKNRGERRALKEQQKSGNAAAATGTAAPAASAAAPAAATTAGVVGAASSSLAATQPAASVTSMEDWLGSIGLSSYIDQIKSYGYVQMSMLLDASEEDIVEMTADTEVVNMKKPARKSMIVQWRKLQQ